MSVCRPTKPRPLFAGCPTHPEHADHKHDYMGNLSNYGDPCSFQLEPATPADLIAVVRRQVESGTIKGEMRRWCVKHGSSAGKEVCEVAINVAYRTGRNPFDPIRCKLEDRLVIPVSDGGSET